jgi:SRSO17 transposase
MLWRSLDAGVPAAWVTGDTVYGGHRPLRAGLEERQQAYALAVSCQEYVEVAGQPQRGDRLAEELAPETWQRLRAGAGSKGPRRYDWARLELSSPAPAGWERWLVIRRSIAVGAKPPKLAYVLVVARKGTTLQEIVLVIGTRWTVEQCFEVGKDEVGLDEYEVRSWQGWYRHITLCMLAQAFLTVLRAQSTEQEADQAEQEGKKLTHHPLPPHPSSLIECKRQRGLTCP